MPRAKKTASKFTKLTLEEVFDQHALNWIIQNADMLVQKIKAPKDQEGFKYAIGLCKEYLKRSKRGVVAVNYIQTDDKAFYCEHSIGMQSMIRYIRHTIAKAEWIDIDMQNAEPMILYWFLGSELGFESESDDDDESESESGNEKSENEKEEEDEESGNEKSDNDDDDNDETDKKHTKKSKSNKPAKNTRKDIKGMKYFNEYIQEREAVLKKVAADLDSDRTHAKKAVLCVLNCDDEDYVKATKKSRYLKKLHAEIRQAFKTITESKAHKKAFAKWTEETKVKDAHGRDKRKREKFPNYASRYINDRFVKTKMCEILLFMHEKFGSPKRAVLCFDGIMLAKNKGYEQRLEAMEYLVKKEFDVDIVLQVKEFNEAWDLSKFTDNIPLYEEVELKRNPLSAINNREDYYYTDVVKEVIDVVFENMEEMKLVVIPKLLKVYAKIGAGSNGYSILKVSSKSTLEVIKETTKSGFDHLTALRYKEDGKINFITIGTLAYTSLNYLPLYNSMSVCLKDEEKVFNLRKPLQAKRLPEGVEVDMSKIQPMIDHVRNIICGGEERLFNYLMLWVKGMCMLEVLCIAVIIIGLEGAGKSIFFEFLMLWVIGRLATYSDDNMKEITSKFNISWFGVAFALVNELSTSKESFHETWDIMKNRITAPCVQLQGKGKEKIFVDSTANLGGTSNHDDCIKLSPDDRRYFIIKALETKVGNKEYFTHIIDTCFNQESGDHFFTWIQNFKVYNVDGSEDKREFRERDIPMTEAKQRMIRASLPSHEKYIAYLKNAVLKENPIDKKMRIDAAQLTVHGFDKKTMKISASKLYENYLKWCVEGNVKKPTEGSKFGEEMKKLIEKGAAKGSNTYCIKSLFTEAELEPSPNYNYIDFVEEFKSGLFTDCWDKKKYANKAKLKQLCGEDNKSYHLDITDFREIYKIWCDEKVGRDTLPRKEFFRKIESVCVVVEIENSKVVNLRPWFTEEQLEEMPKQENKTNLAKVKKVIPVYECDSDDDEADQTKFQISDSRKEMLKKLSKRPVIIEDSDHE